MKKKSFLYFGAGLVLVLILNLLAQELVWRIDLTEDQRYTISEASVNLLESLEEEVLVKVYLEGEDFPADFKRLKNSVKELLEEFQLYAGKNIKFRFIDPLAIEDAGRRDSLLKELDQKGIRPTNVFVSKEGKRSEKLLFPGALISYKNRQTSLLLIKGDQRASKNSSAEIINQSIENIEYEFASAIKKLTQQERKRVGLLIDYTLFDQLELADAWFSLNQYYDMFPVTLRQSPSLDGLDAIIVAKPDTSFREEDKYKIDQFIMKGGKALFFIDALDIREDSIRTQGITPAIAYEHRLTDLFFRYGVRFNEDFIEDLECGFVDLIIGNLGNVPQMETLPWRPYPIVSNFFPHPALRNLDHLFFRYVSTLDTVAAPGIRKIPLLTTSPYTKVKPLLEGISYNDARQDPSPQEYNQGAKTVAYLLEGAFTSLYKNRILSSDPRAKDFVEQGQATKLLIVSDGDFLRNEVNRKTGAYAPMGYDKITGVSFGNRRFLLNMMDYLLDEQGLILARNKEIKLRPLDKKKLERDSRSWQLFNLLLPLLLIVVLGLLRYFWRKYRYGRKTA